MCRIKMKYPFTAKDCLKTQIKRVNELLSFYKLACRRNKHSIVLHKKYELRNWADNGFR